MHFVFLIGGLLFIALSLAWWPKKASVSDAETETKPKSNDMRIVRNTFSKENEFWVERYSKHPHWHKFSGPFATKQDAQDLIDQIKRPVFEAVE